MGSSLYCCFLLLLGISGCVVANLDPMPCADNIFGCGFDESDSARSQCCDCRATLSAENLLPFLVYCVTEPLATGIFPLCCPCLNNGTWLSSESMLDCASQSDLKKVVRLLKRNDRIVARFLRKCGSSQAFPPFVQRRLKKIGDKLQDVVDDIKDDCDLCDPPSCDYGSY